MALTNEQKNQAKQEAKQYLEYSIYTLALILGLDPESLNENTVNDEDKELEANRWNSMESLIKQIQAYAKL